MVGVIGEGRKQEEPVDSSHVRVETRAKGEAYSRYFSIVERKIEQHRHYYTNHRQCFTAKRIRLLPRARWLVYLATLTVAQE